MSNIFLQHYVAEKMLKDLIVRTEAVICDERKTVKRRMVLLINKNEKCCV